MVKKLKYAKYHIDNDLKGRIIQVNAGFSETTGYSYDEVMEKQMTIFDLVPDSQLEEYMKLVHEAKIYGEIYLSHDICCKDGRVIKVHCFGEIYTDVDTGHSCSKVLINDVTEHANVMDELNIKSEQFALQMEKMKFLAEDSQEIFIDYDIQRDYFEVSMFVEGEYKQLFSKENYFTSEEQGIHEDDFEAVCQAFLVANNKNSKQVIDFRSRRFKDYYNWYRLTYTTFIYPTTGKSHIIGRIMDINDEKLASLQITDGVHKDKLTSVYNKTTTEAKINEILTNNGAESEYALLLIDLKHLEQIQMTMGYDQGDLVLESTGQLLLNMFRQNFDIIGRIDDNIFVIFMRNASDVFYVESRCMEICMRVRQECTPLHSNYSNIAHIGIALGNGKIGSFKKLHNKARKALERQKDKDKEGYSF